MLFSINRFNKKQIYIGSLDNPLDRKKAVAQIKAGEPLVMQLGGVYGLFADVQNSHSIQRIFEIKGEQKRNLTIIKRTDEIIHFADYRVISDEFRGKLSEIGKNLGLIAHLRFPVDPEYAKTLPEYTYNNYKDEITGQSYPLVQFLDPSEHSYMSELINELYKQGIKHIAVTSFNDHSKGEPEITEKERAVELSREKSLPMILEDPLHRKHDVKGSYAIVSCFQDSLDLVRHGAIDAKIINAILEGKLQLTANGSQINPNSHDYSKLISLIEKEGLTGKRAKNAFLLYMTGIEPEYMLTQLI